MNKNSTAFAAASALARILQGSSARLRSLIALSGAVAFGLLHCSSAHAQPPVVQRGYDAGVSGATLSETTLTTSNVVPGRFGLVFKLFVDDNVMAQPLYVANVPVNKAAHNVVYVATLSDTLYAFDADRGGDPLWTRHLASFSNAVARCVDFGANRMVIGNRGILGTPVIDRSTNTLYAVTCTLENDTPVYRLHAVDITNGVSRPASGAVISGSYHSVTFDAHSQWQRVSLVLAGNNVVFGFAASNLEGTSPLYSGWVMAYDKNTLAQTGIFATVTLGNGGGGVWQSGRPPVVDGSGHVYVITGNAYGDGYDGVRNFSESVLKLDPAHGLRLLDWFTPGNWSTLDGGDLDLSGSGPMLIPGTRLVVGGGKSGVLYVLRATSLGKNTADDSGAVQKIQIAPAELLGGPVYWQRSAARGGPLLYDWGAGDRLKAFRFNGSRLATTPSAQGSIAAGYPGGILTLSASGDTSGTGVLWATASAAATDALYAFDAGNVARELWDSKMAAALDSFGNFAKFVPPLVANGRVYVATSSKQVSVFGLTAPKVTGISPASGSVSGGTSVRISGRNFLSGATVTVAGIAATSVTVVNTTTITARVPRHARGAVNVTVTNPRRQNSTLTDGFRYLPP